MLTFTEWLQTQPTWKLAIAVKKSTQLDYKEYCRQWREAYVSKRV